VRKSLLDGGRRGRENGFSAIVVEGTFPGMGALWIIASVVFVIQTGGTEKLSFIGAM